MERCIPQPRSQKSEMARAFLSLAPHSASEAPSPSVFELTTSKRNRNQTLFPTLRAPSAPSPTRPPFVHNLLAEFRQLYLFQTTTSFASTRIPRPRPSCLPRSR